MDSGAAEVPLFFWGPWRCAFTPERVVARDTWWGKPSRLIMTYTSLPESKLSTSKTCDTCFLRDRRGLDGSDFDDDDDDDDDDDEDDDHTNDDKEDQDGDSEHQHITMCRQILVGRP